MINVVVGEKLYPRNGRTASQFLILDKRDFKKDKRNLIQYVVKIQNLGEDYFEK